MNRKYTCFVLVVLLVLLNVTPVFAGDMGPFESVEPLRQGNPVPIGFLAASDGHKIPIYLLPENPDLTRAALKAGFITEQQVAESRILTRDIIAAINESPSEGHPWCPFGGTAATLISKGWDYDNDYFKDYEHPVGWNDDFICMTTFYWAWTSGRGPAHEYHNDYQPGIARHRLKIGLTGTPGWFAAAQVYMRWGH